MTPATSMYLFPRDLVLFCAQVENLLIDDAGNYVLCDFGSATTLVLCARHHGVKEVEDELHR